MTAKATEQTPSNNLKHHEESPIILPLVCVCFITSHGDISFVGISLLVMLAETQQTCYK